MGPDREPRQDRTSEDNDVMTASLGALAWLDRFAAAAQPRGPAPMPDHALLTAALGLMSLRRSLRRWAQQAGEAPPPAAPMPDARPLEGLMR
jgi:hypothetical protein